MEGPGAALKSHPLSCCRYIRFPNLVLSLPVQLHGETDVVLSLPVQLHLALSTLSSSCLAAAEPMPPPCPPPCHPQPDLSIVHPANEFPSLSASALGTSPSHTVARQSLIFLASGAVAIGNHARAFLGVSVGG